MRVKKMGLPKKRSELIVQRLGSEMLVYDQTSHRAHSLNETATLVFEKLDGKKDVSRIASELGKSLGTKNSPALVAAAVNDLAEAKLIEPGAVLPRRSVLRGIAAAAIPLVASVAVPPAVAAASCVGFGSPCTPGMYGSSDCCYGLSCVPQSFYPFAYTCTAL
jgi:hypothetical protein